jgi:molybdopterin-guanine dinucleotide biosynthesis protein B
MKVFSIKGCSSKERDLIVEKIAKELSDRGHSVGVLKEVSGLEQTGDLQPEPKNHFAELTIERGPSDTAFRVSKRLSLDATVGFYNQDYLIVVGDIEINAPKIECVSDIGKITAKPNHGILAYCAHQPNEKTFNGIPVFDCKNEICFLSDLIQEKVFEKLPHISSEGCGRCGKSCTEIAVDIVNGKASRNDCISSRDRVKIIINKKELPLVPFVEDIVESVVKGLLSPLKGYEVGDISITISQK